MDKENIAHLHNGWLLSSVKKMTSWNLFTDREYCKLYVIKLTNSNIYENFMYSYNLK